MAAIGLVVGDSTLLTAGDSAVQTLLQGAGHTVTIVDDSAAVPGGQACFVITESGSPATLAAKYTAIATPVVSLETGGWDDLLMTTANATNGGSGTTWDLDTHPITAGLDTASPVTMKTGSSGRFGVADTTLGTGAQIFGRHPTTATHIVGFAYDTGGNLTTGTAPARRVAIGYIDNWPSTLTTAGQQLLTQAVTWALGAAPQTVEIQRITTTTTPRTVGRVAGAVSRQIDRHATTTSLRTLSATVGPVTREVGRIAAATSLRTLTPTPGHVSRSLAHVAATTTLTELAAVPAPVARQIDRIVATATVRTLTAVTPAADRDITVLATTDPTTAWTAADPASGWAAAEPVTAWTGTEPATAWQGTEPQL